MMPKDSVSRAHWWWIVSGIGLVLAGCTDAPPERLDDVPMSCTPETHDYRLTAIDPSVDAADKLDLDGNGKPDDALGHGHDLIAAVDPAFAVAPRFAARLASDVPWVMSIDRCGDQARVTIDQGATVGDGTTEMFVPKLLPRAVGTVSDGALAARDGSARVPLAALADALDRSHDAGWLEGDGMQITATLNADGSLDGVFAIGLRTDAARAELAPPLAAFLSAQAPDDALRTGADADHDGTVTAAEVAATEMFRDIVADDVTIHGAGAASIAFAFHATRLR